MVPVQVITFYVDDTDDTLKAYYDFNNDGVMDESDVEVVAANVKSLQFAIGYDIDGDGEVTDTGNNMDEWLGNHPGEAIGADGLIGADDTMARMITVGVVVADAAPHLSSDRSASVLNGPTVSAPRTVYGVAQGTVTLRNLDVFY